MLYGKLDDFEAMGLRSLGGAISRSIDWIRELPANPEEGRYELGRKKIYALVMSYATVDPAKARFETHRKHVDLQYSLQGGEVIEWAARESLARDGGYDPDKDVQFHRAGQALGRIVKTAGYFSIFTPVDAHRPKIRTAGFGSVTKVVVKIPVGLLSLR
jgi:YhcH/YjgK/YiaL family protein